MLFISEIVTDESGAPVDVQSVGLDISQEFRLDIQLSLSMIKISEGEIHSAMSSLLNVQGIAECHDKQILPDSRYFTIA